MHGGYVRNLARLNLPAAIGIGRVVFNAAAEMMFLNDPLARQRCVEALNAVRVARSSLRIEVGVHAHWSLVPAVARSH